MPALNEEANIAAAVQEVLRALEGRCADYEVLLIDDGSRDRTGPLMDALAAANPRLRVTHNSRPRNLGGVFKQGLAMARHEYFMMVPGDNENPAQALVGPLQVIGAADLVIPFTVNRHVRPWSRRLASHLYTTLLNGLFGRRLRYYNGTIICRTSDLRTLSIRTNSFAYVSEIVVKLLQAGKHYVEVGVEIQPPRGRQSKAFTWRNVSGVFNALLWLCYDIHLSPAMPAAPLRRHDMANSL